MCVAFLPVPCNEARGAKEGLNCSKTTGWRFLLLQFSHSGNSHFLFLFNLQQWCCLSVVPWWTDLTHWSPLLSLLTWWVWLPFRFQHSSFGLQREPFDFCRIVSEGAALSWSKVRWISCVELSHWDCFRGPVLKLVSILPVWSLTLLKGLLAREWGLTLQNAYLLVGKKIEEANWFLRCQQPNIWPKWGLSLHNHCLPECILLNVRR